MIYPLVYIRWVDASSPHSSWMSEEDFINQCKPVYVNSVGYIIHETDDHIKLGQSYFDPTTDEPRPQVSCGVAIPKAWIVERANLTGVYMGKG